MSPLKIKTIYTSSKYVLTLEEDNCIKLRETRYCIVGYGNRVERVVELDKQMRKVRVYENRYDCGGTGSTLINSVALTDEEFNKLYKAVKNVKTLDDFENVLNVVKEIEEQHNKKVDEMVSEIIDRIVNTKNVPDKNDLKDYLEEAADEYIRGLGEE